MLPKKFYIPIGILILVICAIGFLSLRSDVPDEPIKIYKVTQPAEQSDTQTETAKSDTAEGGHSHADGAFQEETGQEKKARLMQRLAEAEARTKAAEARTKAAEARTKAAEARTKAYRDEIEAIKARNAERTKYLSQITEKGKEFAANFQDMLAMTPDQYLALSETQQEDFLLRCVEYDLFVKDMQGIIRSMPQWVIDELNDRRPGEVDEFLNLPLLHELYGRL